LACPQWPTEQIVTNALNYGYDAIELRLLDGEVIDPVKDALRIGPTEKDWQLKLLGEGEVPVREQLQLLQQNGYSGYASVEWEKKWHPEFPEPEVALPQHIRWLKALPFLQI
jgi:sugar phosphate isomerase/epimerase